MPRIGLFSYLCSGLSGKVQFALAALGLALLGLQAWYTWPTDYRPPRTDTARATIDRQTLRERKDLLSQIPDSGAVPPTPVSPTAPTQGRGQGGGAGGGNPNAIAGPIAIPAPVSLSIPDASTPHPISIDGGSPLDIAFHPSRFGDPHAVRPPPTTTQDSGLKSQDSIYAEALRLEKARAFTMSMCFDLQGRLWIGSENNQPGDGTGGVQVYDPSKPPLEAWTQFTVKDGLGDDNGYAIACDLQGRIWVGHLNHGVSVYNGTKWQNYEVVGGLSRPDTLSGPLGERIFHITVCPPLSPQHSALSTFIDPLTNKESPLAGSVWMCTSAGLAIYFPATDTWSYLTRADGLPSDQANSLAFDQEGAAYLATQCDGIAIASPSDHYAKWRQISAQDSGLKTQDLPTTPTGYGLPTNLLNDILVAHDNTVYAATTAGLAWSTDKGESWKFVRGADWADKVKGRLGGPPQGWSPQPGAILSEDYSTALAEDAQGNIHVGHRAATGDVLRPRAEGRAGATSSDYATSLLIVNGVAASLRSTYGEGIGVNAPRDTNIWLVAASLSPQSRLPKPAAPHTPEELAKLTSYVKSLGESDAPVVYLGQDWSTQGSWLGRYGRYWMVQAAGIAPKDLYWGQHAASIDYHTQLGIGAPGDGLRYWVSANQTKDPRSLELPMPYLHNRVEKQFSTWELNRRQSEWDDHGEIFQSSKQGPGIFFSISVPKGTFCLSFYNANDNGKSGANRYRDFVLSVREHPKDKQLFDNRDFQNWPLLAKARVSNYWGGEYTRFLVQGPCKLTMYVDRNYSYNANLNGVFLDTTEEFPATYYGTLPSERRRLALTKAKSEDDQRAVVFAKLGELCNTSPPTYVELQTALYVALARTYAQSVAEHAEHRDEDLAFFASCVYRLHLYSQWEEMQHRLKLTTSRDIEKALRWNGVSAAIYPNMCQELIAEYVQKSR